MTKAVLENFKHALLGLRNRLTGDVSHLAGEAFRSASGDNGASAAPQHPADLGTDAFEQEFTLSLMENQEQVLEQIDDALERLRSGKFGRCEDCGAALTKGRLQALPYARQCVACAAKAQ